jgi:hypothetical protein
MYAWGGGSWAGTPTWLHTALYTAGVGRVGRVGRVAAGVGAVSRGGGGRGGRGGDSWYDLSTNT